ncbi:MAG: bifunctional 5,10-methylenetetrahydrofolate dehydrogenase/5,10-methenyltetrahydrofolate cyclohydrolase [Chlamydiae bacterium]|nr:bifunctional 5,10-methylenetetrahydrofolate dehydrogenase/5,10-methenyltetrahydrofolate cyclohydrolase [Chlamydiota bacterium]
MKLLQARDLANSIEQRVRKEILTRKRAPGLAFIRIGDDSSSKVYIAIKKKKCAEVGILSFDKELPASLSEQEVLRHIEGLNEDPRIDGILLQLPIPSHLSTMRILQHIDPKKDVDGFHPYNMGKLLLGDLSGPLPCTPKGIHLLLQSVGISIPGKHVVIVGRSNIVGKPLAALLMQKDPSCNATVTLIHTSSCNIQKHCQEADILIAALGNPGYIKKDMVQKGAVVIDVGINREGSSLVGDVDFANVAPLTSYITPVPGGVGPMTVACLLSNTVDLSQ